MTLEEYLAAHPNVSAQASERLFVEDFLYPLLGQNIRHVIPQHPFIDRAGSNRRIDFAYIEGARKIALEVNGESYHAEGILPFDQFDNNLFRQNEIIAHGYYVLRFSYSQLQSAAWRPIIQDTLRETFEALAPNLLSSNPLVANEIQLEALEALAFHRSNGHSKGVVILPTGTGKTILSALDASRFGGRVLFVVHRLDILKQSIGAFKRALGKMSFGVLTGEVRDSVFESDYLFASKETLAQAAVLTGFDPQYFDYIIIDEVHHGESAGYRGIFEWFNPRFMLGMTATPDRTDRKDILELFDYHKIYEITLSEVIERGWLVPYSYYGLTDNIDYSNVRYSGNKYRVDDLERALIVPQRNEAILREYLDKGQGNKAVGFCVSIEHADRMAEFFTEHGVSAVAIHSKAVDRDALLVGFRNNQYQVAFTVDLFNEGIDFPNLRVLLFLRPTESKTVFTQQLGRGLRLCSGKDRVIILDFIGNYKRANQIRKYLAKSGGASEHTEKRNQKVLYEYATGCEVSFSVEVQEILDRQDAEDRGVTREDLILAYHAVAEQLERKPSRADLDENGAYKSSVYVRLFGSWMVFLREIGEVTEASYHYPQGTTLGHILAILWHFSKPTRDGTPFADEFIRMRGNLASDRLGSYQRQIKYKLQAAMELGILVDVRQPGSSSDLPVTLTPLGRQLARVMHPYCSEQSAAFPKDEDGLYSTRTPLDDEEYVEMFRKASAQDGQAAALIRQIFLGMEAVRQMLAYLYRVARKPRLAKQTVYDQFFESPDVTQFCDRQGIERATPEASKRRCPFLLNILSALGVLTVERSSIEVRKMLLTPDIVRSGRTEAREAAAARLHLIAAAWPKNSEMLDENDLSLMREIFGVDFLTDKYYIHELELIETDRYG